MAKEAISDWSDVKKVAARGFKDAVEAQSLASILERSNRPTVVGGLNSQGAGRAATLLVHAMIARLVLFATRDIAPSRKKSDLTFDALYRFLNRYDFSEYLPVPEDAADVRLALELFSEYKNDPIAKKLVHYRNKFVAHIAIPEMDAPIFHELFDCVDRASLIWEKLANGTGVFTMLVSDQVKAYEESADKLWSPWEQRQAND
ncbi:hypothetical protein [Brucella pseudogrignonensis]|uniref:HEPN AbiU2-like domain-containing protein n=1 Tax=Brucella pseudogrignonensis TaxID=419475 RepID=A0ABU1M5I0_9HYPH|nr:hypothetical protein [Brucella pseudogrignonensis]MDR6431272.1 hypothetical protein [Brucella pseudogrignonensis]